MSSGFPLPRPLPRLVVGDGLTLRLWGPEDVEAVRALVERSTDSLSAFLPWAAEPLSAEQEAQIQADAETKWSAALMAGWAILEADEIRGMLGLHRRGGPDELEIGYWLDVEATGRGLMTRACTMALDVAFSYGEVGVVEIVHDAANRRSASVPSRLGFSRRCAFTAPAVARCESGIKVRWTMDRDAWLGRGAPTSVRHAG